MPFQNHPVSCITLMVCDNRWIPPRNMWKMIRCNIFAGLPIEKMHRNFCNHFFLHCTNLNASLDMRWLQPNTIIVFFNLKEKKHTQKSPIYSKWFSHLIGSYPMQIWFRYDWFNHWFHAEWVNIMPEICPIATKRITQCGQIQCTTIGKY